MNLHGSLDTYTQYVLEESRTFQRAEEIEIPLVNVMLATIPIPKDATWTHQAH